MFADAIHKSESLSACGCQLLVALPRMALSGFGRSHAGKEMRGSDRWLYARLCLLVDEISELWREQRGLIFVGKLLLLLRRNHEPDPVHA